MIGALFPFAETTDGVTVRVSVSFLPEQSQPGLKRWFWAYHIRIENDGDLPVQLLGRQWRIVDGSGAVHEVAGEGVVGVQPIIAPGSSYDYVSGCPLSTPEGSMVGNYEMVDGDDRHFLVAIPHFPLVAPSFAS